MFIRTIRFIRVLLNVVTPSRLPNIKYNRTKVPRQGIETPRHLIAISRHSVANDRRLVEVPRHLLVIHRHLVKNARPSVAIARLSVKNDRHSFTIDRHLVATARHSVMIARRSVAIARPHNLKTNKFNSILWNRLFSGSCRRISVHYKLQPTKHLYLTTIMRGRLIG